MTQLYLLAIKTNRNSKIKLRIVIKKSLQEERWEKPIESCLSRKISELLKTLTSVIFSLTSL